MSLAYSIIKFNFSDIYNKYNKIKKVCKKQSSHVAECPVNVNQQSEDVFLFFIFLTTSIGPSAEPSQAHQDLSEPITHSDRHTHTHTHTHSDRHA